MVVVATRTDRRARGVCAPGRLNAAYVYVSCGPLESTKDVVFGKLRW